MEAKAKELVELLQRKNLKISAAESCTGGLFTKLLTDVPGSSAVLDLSAVTYANEAKVKLLGVSEDSIQKYGVVSRDVACQMAEGVKTLSGADVGVGITGIAGPDGATQDKPVGLVWTAISYNGTTTSYELKLSGSREDIRQQTSLITIDNVLNIIS